MKNILEFIVFYLVWKATGAWPIVWFVILLYNHKYTIIVRQKMLCVEKKGRTFSQCFAKLQSDIEIAVVLILIFKDFDSLFLLQNV